MKRQKNKTEFVCESCDTILDSEDSIGYRQASETQYSIEITKKGIVKYHQLQIGIERAYYCRKCRADLMSWGPEKIKEFLRYLWKKNRKKCRKKK